MFRFLRLEDDEDPESKVVRINSHGTAPTVFDEDKAIASCKADNDKRRTVKVDRSKLGTSWGFTLQSHGIYNSKARCIENYTYVDYVEVKSPSFKSGMRRGDIIFAVDGQSTEDLSHDELVEKIQSCKNSMRLVLVNSDICQKIELYQRQQKLQAVLRQKQSELKNLENREAAMLYNVRARVKERQMRRLKVLAQADQTPTSNQKETSFTTENNNIKASPKPPASSPSTKTGRTQCDVRPKLSPYMSKLALSNEPTAYERTLLSQARQAQPSPQTRTSTMQRCPKGAIVTNGTQSLRLTRSPQSKVS